MYICIYIDILAWVWFEPTTTELRSDALIDWAIYHAMSSTHVQSQLCTATSISSFVQCHISFFISAIAFVSHHVYLIEVLLR